MILKLRTVLAMICLVGLAHLSFSQAVTLVPWSSGFDSPVDMTNAGDDRLFIVEQDGIIKVVSASGVANSTNFLNISSGVGSGGNEQGLLGLAFHPDYENNGYFFVNYTDNSGNTKICRFEVSATNPDSADASTETLILSVNQDFSNHNGGCIKFGPDGYLYVGVGDGGSGSDPN